MKTVKVDTIIRTVVLVIALINQILAVCGYSLLPITDEQINDIITLIFTISASLWSWWKNNSFTQDAMTADEYLKELREGE